jgi:PAS domain S-box-containing protein
MDSSVIRLLLVEDNEIDRLAFERFIKNERLPYDQTDAGSVAEGKERLKTDRFDAVLLDYSLRDGTAFDLIEDVPEEIPAIIITGSGNEEIAVQAMKFGASDYLIKDPENNWLKTVPITVRNVIKAKGDEKALRKAHAELELRVEQRTEELMQANRQLTMEIERRKLMEEALRSSQERFRALTETTSEWIWEMDPEGIITYASPRATDLLGYRPEEILGKRRFDLMPASEAERVSSQFKFVVKSRRPFKNLESLSEHKDGRAVMLASSGVPFFDSTGKLRGYRGIDLDISDRKKAEELLVQSERLKAIAELSSGVAHNFNNLLQIVVTGLQLVLIELESGDVTTVRRTIERILESSNMGAETVKWLQDFAFSQTDTLMEGGKVFCLSETVQRAIEVSKPWWKTTPERDGVVISVESDLVPNCLVKGKESAIFEVVINLLKNAAEALAQGGLIAVSTVVDRGAAVLRVKDTGVGIPKENLGRVFEPFFTTKGFQGTGMGLAAAYGIVKRHGGDITVESDPGQGTEFTVDFPLAKEALRAVAPEVEEFPWRLRMLLIDDEALIVKILGTQLKKYHQEVFTALSGQQGLELFHSHDVDLILSDLGMPVINGWKVGKTVKEICEAEGRPKPLFLLLTGWGKNALRDDRIAESGVDAVVAKPVTVRKLLRIIADLMEKRKEYQ